jgi:outer membrane protein assembly factor BamB
MRTLGRWAALCASAALLWTGQALGQDWTTIGNDAQRSNWLRSSAKISPETVKAPDFQLTWKHDLDAEARLQNALTPPVLLDFLISHTGFRSLAFVADADGTVFAVDTDLNRMEWERRFGVAMDYPAPTADCPGGMTSSLTRPTEAALPALGGFSGFGRRSPGFSGVGKPSEGAITLKAERSPGFRRPEPPKPGARQQPPARRKLSGLTVVHALTADGMFRTLLVSNGYDHGSPMPFLPANANAQGLMVVDDVAYVATSNGCGGVPDGVWALDTTTGKVASWKAGSGSVAGMTGYAVGPDGTVYAATTDGRIVALEPKTLKEKAAHKGGGAYATAPVLIDYNDQDYLAVASKDGAVSLFEAAKLAGEPLSKTSGGALGSGAIATWRDSDDVTWVLVPRGGAVEALKFVEESGKPVLKSGWTASGIASPLPPIIVNGVVFAASGGDLASSRPAVLYALDGATGKKLWDSGAAIKAPAPATGLTAGPNTIYLGTHDGALYAFGYPIEH